MKQGVLVYDQKSERMDVRFGLEDYYGGLHCGTCMDVFVTTDGNRLESSTAGMKEDGIWLGFPPRPLWDCGFVWSNCRCTSTVK